MIVSKKMKIYIFSLIIDNLLFIMQSSTSVEFENYLENIILNFKEEKNPPVRVNCTDQINTITSLRQAHQHELFTEMNDFLDYHRDDDHIERSH